jgi:hypothetical protein
MTKKLLFLLILLLATIPAFAETVDTAWVRRYNGPGNAYDGANAIAVDNSGNVYVTGESYSDQTGTDCTTIKYYSNGDISWVRRYNGRVNDHDEGYVLTIDDSGNVYVAGYCCYNYNSGTSADYVTVKYYSNGNTAWARTYNGPGNGDDLAYAITVDDSGNVYVTGESPGNGTGYDYATIKYYPDGDTAWVRRYNGFGDYYDYAYDIAADDSGNIYVTGLSPRSGTISDYTTIKYYPNGDTAWVRRYNSTGTSADCAGAIAVDDSSNVYVTGTSGTIKYDAEGNELWTGLWGGIDIALDASHNVYVTDGGYDFITARYYPNGDTAWVRSYNGPGNGYDYGNAVAVDSSGNVYVTGDSPGNGTISDYATIKYYSDGDTAWTERYNGPGNALDHATAIAVDSSGNVYVTGHSGDFIHPDYATVKYVQTSDVVDEPGYEQIPSEFVLSQNYPNPFNTSTKIEFALKNSGFVSLNIYNILGRKVRTLVSEDLSIGNKSIVWDGKDDSGNNVASGTYFYRIKTKDFSESKKLVLLK